MKTIYSLFWNELRRGPSAPRASSPRMGVQPECTVEVEMTPVSASGSGGTASPSRASMSSWVTDSGRSSRVEDETQEDSARDVIATHCTVPYKAEAGEWPLPETGEPRHESSRTFIREAVQECRTIHSAARFVDEAGELHEPRAMAVAGVADAIERLEDKMSQVFLSLIHI